MPLDLDEYRAQSLANWNEMAGGWERGRDWLETNTAPVTERLLELADPRPGQSVLELAAGTGGLGRAIAERVRPDGTVLSTDFSPEMVDAARRSAGRPGNVEHRVLDAERTALPDASFDLVVCRFGFMLMADPAAALREARRVLRNGRVLAFAVWAGPDRNPWAARPGAVLVERGHVPPAEPGTPGIFSLADPQRIRALVTAAGFAEPDIEDVAFALRYEDRDELWETLRRLSGALARTLSRLEPDEQRATRAAIEESLAQWLGADGVYAVPALARVARAR
jgi:SAM-dependent methyltransferase